MSSSHLHSYVWCEFDSDEVEIIDFPGGELAFFSRRCPTRQKTTNEDSACIVEVSEECRLLAVADGVGGGAAGHEASRCAVENLAKACFGVPSATHESQGLRGQVLDAIESANREILSWGVGSGTTLTAIELANDQFRYYHLGDSGALVTSNRGSLKFSTVGHAPVAQAVAIGMLDSEEALVHEDRNLISNCVGSREMKIELGIFRTISSRDTLLLATDGLYDNLSKLEIADLIRKGDLFEQTKRLVTTAKYRMATGHGKPDDITLICYRSKPK